MKPDNIDKAKLISEIYEVILKPERYDSFMALWEQYISGEISKLIVEDSASTRIEKYIKDPELEVHFRRVYEILEKLGREEKEIGTPQDYIAQKNEPTIFFNVEGKVVIANNHATKLLGNISELSQISDFVTAKDFEKLQTMLLNLLSPNTMEQIYIFHLNIDSQKESKNNYNGLYLAKILSFPNHDALLSIHALGVDWDINFETLLANAFQFTSSELKIGKGLCEGKSLEEIAEERKRSVHTIRAQVKSMLRKCDANSQSDLVRLMATLSYLGRSQPKKLATALGQLEFNKQILVTVTNGRNMPVHIIGAEEGKEVIFLHGMLDGIILYRPIGKLLAKNNIKLIAPVRPSFANSPPAYNIQTAPEEFAKDLQYIMDYLQIDKAPIIGHMAGAVYAYAAAGLLQDRIDFIFNVSGAVPIKSFRQLSSMPRRQRAVAWTARFAPKMLPTILRAGISQIDRGDEDKFMSALYTKGRWDREVLTNAEIRRAIFNSYQFAVAQGHRAFEVDSRHVTRDWSEYLVGVRQQVVLAHGVLDPTVTISSVRNFAPLYDNIKLIEHKDAGQLLFYQKPKAIISTLTRLLKD